MPVDGEGEGEEELGIAAAPAIAAQGHGGLAAREQERRAGEGPVAGADFAGERGVDLGHVARLALDGIGEDVRR